MGQIQNKMIADIQPSAIASPGPVVLGERSVRGNNSKPECRLPPCWGRLMAKSWIGRGWAHAWMRAATQRLNAACTVPPGLLTS